jgi:hypothetical protein
LLLVGKNRHPDSISLVVVFIRFYKLKFNQYKQRLGINVAQRLSVHVPSCPQLAPLGGHG